MRAKWVRRLGIGAVLLALAAGIAVLALRPTIPPRIIGMVRTTEIKIEPEVSGRIAALPFKAGDRVSAGAVVAALSNPELAAAVEEARAAVAVAQATRDRVYAGVRQEEVNIAAQETGEGQCRSDLGEAAVFPDLGSGQPWARNAAGSGQRPGERRHGRGQSPGHAIPLCRGAARPDSGRPRARRRQPRGRPGLARGAGAAVRQAPAQIPRGRGGGSGRGRAGGSDGARPHRADHRRYGEPWFDFNIREDELRGLGIGTPLVLIEGTGGKQVSAKVSEMRRLGDFATWRAARAVGDHDLNTFSVRADPVDTVEGLEPGVTVWIAGR